VTVRALVTWVELEVPTAGSRVRVYWTEFETPSPTGTVAKLITESSNIAAAESAVRTIIPIVSKSITDSANISGTEGRSVSQSTAPVINTDLDWPALVVGGTYGIATNIDLATQTQSTDVAGFASADIARGSAAPAVLEGLGSGVTITTAIYRATRDNAWLEDISDRVEGGVVHIDTGQVSQMTFQAQTTERDVLSPYRDWIAPVMTLTVPQDDGSGTARFTEQLGLYMMMPPVMTDSASQGMDAIDGRDVLWLFASSGPGKAYSIAAGTNIVTAMRTICDTLSVRHAIQTSSRTTSKKRTWRSNNTWLQIMNDLARSIGFVPVFPDRRGRVRSYRFKRLGDTQPARTISSAAGMVLDQTVREPDLNRVCNHVVVIGNDPKGNPVIARRRNTDPDSSTSAYNLGTVTEPVWISKFVEDPNLDDQDAVDALADRLMDQGTSAFVRMQVKTTPIMTFEINDVAALDIVNDDGLEVASGRWRWDTMTLGLGIEASCQWSMLKLLTWSEVT
jgi:hypothetical protein